MHNRFLRSYTFKQRLFVDDYHIDYYYCSLTLYVATLQRRRAITDICFGFKFIIGLIDRSYLLSRLNFSTFRRTRGRDMFSIVTHSTNYEYFCPIDSIQRGFNVNDLAIHLPLSSFKVLVRYLGCSVWVDLFFSLLSPTFVFPWLYPLCTYHCIRVYCNLILSCRFVG